MDLAKSDGCVMFMDHLTSSQSRLELSEARNDSSAGQTTVAAKNFRNSENNHIQNQKCLQKIFKKKLLERHFPILKWLPKYNKEDFVGDIIAGITDALAVIPLALAFANIAGLPPEFALYSSFMCNIVYTIFGSCKDNILGSTAIASLLTFQVAHGNWQMSVLFTFLSGCIELLMGLARFGFIIDFVSGPVSAGFTSAVALIIFTSQIKNILVVNSSGKSFLENWISIIKDIHNFSLSDTLLGAGSIVVLLILRYIGNLKLKPNASGELSEFAKVVNKFVWFVGVSRNALMIFVTATIVGYLEHRGKQYFQLTGYIPSGFPPLEMPAFSIVTNTTVLDNNGQPLRYETIEHSFTNLLQEFGSNLIVVPLIGLLETMAVCKTFANGKPVDTNQELISLGLANICNSFCRGYRINGGLARGSVNTASGGRTSFVNVYITGIVILALLYLAEYFYYIPKTTLAAIIIAAILFQLQYHIIKPMWQSKKSDLFIGFLAFISCLVLPLSLGISIAIGINILYILYYSARPQITLDVMKTSSGQSFLKLTSDRSLIFPSVEYVRNLVIKYGTKHPMPVVFDCTYISASDFTTAKVIDSIVNDFNERKQKIIFFNLRPKVAKLFKASLRDKLILCYSLDCIEKLLADSGECGLTTAVIKNDNSGSTLDVQMTQM